MIVVAWHPGNISPVTLVMKGHMQRWECPCATSTPSPAFRSGVFLPGSGGCFVK